MFAGFLVVLFVEAADQVFKDCAHGVVVQAGQTDGAVLIQLRLRAEVDLGGEEALDDGIQDVALGQAVDLVTELELFEDVLNVGGEPVQVCLKV